MFSPKFDELVQALRTLPSVGPKSAQRMALNLVMKNKIQAEILANALHNAVNSIRSCQKCHSLTEQDVCDICLSIERDDGLMCVRSEEHTSELQSLV